MSSAAVEIIKAKDVADGLGTKRNPMKYLNQDFEKLREQCLASGTLFKDEEFAACQSALGFNELGLGSSKTMGVVWKRPTFIVDGAPRGDIRQGALDYLYQVVPVDQTFQTNYAGIFHFKKGKLVFVKSAEGNEFWSALLEKAYAKLNGSYEALIGGSPLEALEDFTGGIGEQYYLEKPPADLFQRVQKALKANPFSPPDKVETVANNNVVKNHAYSITGAEEVSFHGQKVQLFRVRNPWGKTEWNGAWSDNAPEWNEIDPNVKLAVCAAVTISSGVCSVYGSWKSGCTAGGCKRYPDTFWTNPQFRIKLEEPDDVRRGRESFLSVPSYLKTEMNVEDLRTLLNRIILMKDEKSEGFSLNTCKEMINLSDIDLTGKLNSKELRSLWIKLDKYMKIFKESDLNDSGTIDAHEMRKALPEAGFILNNQIQEIIVQRSISNGLSVSLDNFIASLIRLETLFKMFELLKSNENGVMSLSLSENSV
ncbi:hypothetical protein GDO86_009125 [Hymenochirus boettgeri]|uniref:Uncharacterized protein n=1 Tax=Hymenochirus boettgeri TaxID=247094 RepID=A0A8T2JJZ6_9PIPI|nr:hypothetical protein GDO86_009125 [Hymenochirus boettgeri]